jgi:hypothetical protein
MPCTWPDPVHQTNNEFNNHVYNIKVFYKAPTGISTLKENFQPFYHHYNIN